ncbi:hypothetical protein SHKM778_11160 [Streptomyces sp. KM77-8]|uniref:Collagen-like protein n=1 Tax=Streptomyces haneummycinicus TaxID=3074435 RepID=A0AAT9HBP0_9ACTN
MLSVLIAGLTLSGVAVAGIGAAGGSSPDQPAKDVGATSGPSSGIPTPSSGTRTPSSGTAVPPADGSTAPETGSGRPGSPGRPDTAKDTEAHCRAYDRVRGRGGALDSTAWKRLVEAAGGAANVGGYCAGLLEADTASEQPGNNGNGNGRSGRSGTGSTGDDGDPGGQGDGPDGDNGNYGDNGKPEKSANPGTDRP